MAKPEILIAQGSDGIITYGLHPTKFGQCLIGTIDKSICYLSFADSKVKGLKELRAAWPDAKLVNDDKKTAPLAKAVFSTKKEAALSFVLLGTPFQIAVWKAIAAIPRGKVSSYAAIAKAVGRPNATRAIGTACGKNKIAYAIPCHRILGANGALGGYSGGLERKVAMLADEAL
jgi:O-6-methylguanine DNA methyltransferase